MLRKIINIPVRQKCCAGVPKDTNEQDSNRHDTLLYAERLTDTDGTVWQHIYSIPL